MASLGSGIKGLLNPSTPCHKRSEVTTRIRGTDMITDIAATNIFGVQSFRINPGNSLLFPRLQAPASIFEKFHVRSLEFEFLPTSAATRSGSVILMVETDTYDSIPTTKEEMLNHQNSARGLPWDRFKLAVTGKDLHPRPQMFIRPEAVAPSDYDARLDDLGELHIGAAVDSETPIGIGELWVHYDIDLISPAVHSTEPTARSFVASAPTSTYASANALAAAFTNADTANTMEEILSVSAPSLDGGDFLSIGPCEALVRVFARGDAASTFTGAPGFGAFNGAALRSLSSSGDFATTQAGLRVFAEDVMSLPGLSLPEVQAVADIALLPYVNWFVAVLAAGNYISGLVSAVPFKNNLSATPFPPMSPLKKFQLQDAWHKKLSTGRFHRSGEDCLIRFGRKAYHTGHGLVTNDWILTKPVQDHSDGKHCQPGPTRCEGACNSVPQKYTFK
jgi:hypothetical protein